MFYIFKKYTIHGAFKAAVNTFEKLYDAKGLNTTLFVKTSSSFCDKKIKISVFGE